MSIMKKVMLGAKYLALQCEDKLSFLEVAGAYINVGAIIATEKLSARDAATELCNTLVLATKGDQEMIEDCLNNSLAAYIMQQAGPQAMLAKGAVHQNEVN
jgi:hypothetical protein